MQVSFSLLLGTCVAGLLVSPLPVAADEAADVSAYYGWLDKYQNPHQHVAASHRPRILPQNSTSADTSSPDAQTAAASIPNAVSPAVNANDVVFGAEAGEGLGCYYHRSYYSHLPMFKAGAYHLPGSLDVAEPYQKTSSTALSSPSPPK